MGISLDLPSSYLNDSMGFKPPTKKDAQTPAEYAEQPTKPVKDGPTPFLWQAPNSNAVLFFGQKWVELHGFVSRHTDVLHRLPASPAAFLSEKSVSKKYPAWLEHALRLSRARGYWMLYPGGSAAGNLATVHTELYKAPEEYEEELANESTEKEESGQRTLATEMVVNHAGGLLLPPFGELPLLSWDGRVVGLAELDASAAEYTTEFRGSVGGCEDLRPRDLLAKESAADLFCEREE
jgi:hypothetical protein